MWCYFFIIIYFTDTIFYTLDRSGNPMLTYEEIELDDYSSSNINSRKQFSPSYIRCLMIVMMFVRF